MGAYQEYSWAHWYGLNGVAVQSLVEPDELRHESHVRVGDLTFLSDEAQPLIKGYPLCEYHVAQAQCR